LVRLGCLAVLTAAAIGILQIAIAMGTYPGGTDFDRSSRHHSFWFNFLCDLTRQTALNGAPNGVGAALARSGIATFAAALALFWMVLPALFRRRSALAIPIRVAGTLSALAIVVVPTASGTAHSIAIFTFAGAGLVAAALGLFGAIRYSRSPAVLIAAGAAIGAAVFESGLYARALMPHPARTVALLVPVFQRIAFLTIGAWVVAASIRILRITGQGPEIATRRFASNRANPPGKRAR
jgi:hypothetical protein